MLDNCFCRKKQTSKKQIDRAPVRSVQDLLRYAAPRESKISELILCFSRLAISLYSEDNLKI